MSGCRIALLGCTGMLVLGMILFGIAAWYVANNFGQVAAQLGSVAIKQVVDQSDLPAEQKTAINARIDSVVTDYKAGKITDEQMKNVGQHILASPLIYVGAIKFYEEKYIKRSELPEAEKTEAIRTLERFARGLSERKLSQNDVQEINEPISVKRADGELELKENPSVHELRQMLKLAKERADAAEIPDEPFNVDIALELDKAVAAGLAGEEVPSSIWTEEEPVDVEAEHLPAEMPE